MVTYAITPFVPFKFHFHSILCHVLRKKFTFSQQILSIPYVTGAKWTLEIKKLAGRHIRYGLILRIQWGRYILIK